MRIAVIGYGGMGEYHCYLLKECAKQFPAERIELTGIYDIDPVRAAEAEKGGIKAYASAQEIWQDQSVDAVLIATPNDLHLPYVRQAAAAGKHIISEKPIALSTKEAEEMYDLAKNAGVVLQVHQNRRWDDDYLTMKNIVSGGQIGEVYKIESRVVGSNGIPGAWRKEKARGGGMMLDWGVHLIDQMLLAVPSKVVNLYCEYSYIYGEEVDDGFDLFATFENGMRYRITVLTDCFRALRRWQVYGTDGTATIEDWDLHGGMTRVVEREDKNLVGVRAGNGFTRTMAQRSGASVEELPLPVVHAQPFVFYRNFASSAAGKQAPTVKKEEVLRVFRLMEAAAYSAEHHCAIRDKI